MYFSEKTVEVGGKILMPDSNVNPLEFAVIRQITPHGIYVVWNPDTDKQQKSYVSFGWLNYKYGTKKEKDTDFKSDDVPNLC